MLASKPTNLAHDDATRSPFVASHCAKTRATSPYTRLGRTLVLCSAALMCSCAGMTPQLPATDVAQLSTLSDRSDREAAYAENQLYTHHTPQGTRYTKGTDPDSVKRSWQSLDVVLRSDANSAAALPDKKLRTARVLATLAVATGIVAVSGFAASSRDGLNLSRLDGPGGMLLGGSVATLALAVAAGLTYGRARTDYTRAVEVYNDSVGMRMGLYTPTGQYIPADNVLVDEEGFIVLSTPEAAYHQSAPQAPAPSNAPAPGNAPAPTSAPTPWLTPAANPAAEAPSAPQPQASQPQANQPQANQPQASQPQASQPQASQPQANQPQASQPQANQPQANQPRANQPQANQPQPQSGVDGGGGPQAPTPRGRSLRLHHRG